MCVDLPILNDHSLEYNETLLVELIATPQDSAFVKIAHARNSLLVNIIEDAQDSMLTYFSHDIHDSICVQFHCTLAIHVGLSQSYYEVVDGEQPVVSICAVLYEGKLEYDIPLELSILSTNIGNSGIGIYYIITNLSY